MTILWLFGSDRFWGTADANRPVVEDWCGEKVLVFGLLALPFVLFLVAKITHSGFTERYALAALLAFPLAAGYILPRFERNTRPRLAALVFFALVAQEPLFWVPLRN